MVEIEPAGEDQFGEASGIALFLAGKPARPQFIKFRGNQRFRWAAIAQPRFQLVPDRCRGCYADLLANNGAKQCFIAFRTDTWFRIARRCNGCCQSGLDRTDMVEAGFDHFF